VYREEQNVLPTLDQIFRSSLEMSSTYGESLNTSPTLANEPDREE
jgi:hypothetical protein